MSNFYRQGRMARLYLKDILYSLFEKSKNESVEVPLVALKLEILEKYEISDKKFFEMLNDYEDYFDNLKVKKDKLYFKKHEVGVVNE